MIEGRRSNVCMKEFGKAVWLRIPETKNLPGKFEPRWEEGVYVGFNIRPGEDLVSTDRGVFRVSTVRRKPVGERWSKQLLGSIAGTPAIPVVGGTGRRMPAYAKRFDNNAARKEPEFVEQPDEEIPQARTWKIMKADIQAYGLSPGCPGCRAIARNSAYRVQHTKECRLRFEKLLYETDEGRKQMEKVR